MACVRLSLQRPGLEPASLSFRTGSAMMSTAAAAAAAAAVTCTTAAEALPWSGCCCAPQGAVLPQNRTQLRPGAVHTAARPHPSLPQQFLQMFRGGGQGCVAYVNLLPPAVCASLVQCTFRAANSSCRHLLCCSRAGRVLLSRSRLLCCRASTCLCPCRTAKTAGCCTPPEPQLYETCEISYFQREATGQT